MQRLIAKGLAGIGMASLVVVGMLGGSAPAAEGQPAGSPAARPASGPLELNPPAKLPDAAPLPAAVLQGAVVAPEAQKSPADTKTAPAAKTPKSKPASDAPGEALASDEGKKEDDKKEPAKKPDVKKAAKPIGAPKAAAKEAPKKGDGKGAAPSAATIPAKKPAPPAAPARLPLSPQMAALRDRVRAVVAQHFRDPLCTSDNTPGQILEFCLAFGCDTEIRYGNSAGSPMSGIGALCFDYACGGFRLLDVGDDRGVLARVGYGFQSSPGELLAVLAQSAVPESYEIRVGPWRGTVANLVDSEKLSCLSGGDLAQKLIGLSHYLPDGATWKNAHGDAWSLERLVRDELNRIPAADSPDVTNHLAALAYAVERHARAGRPMEGQYERAQKFLADYQTFAFSLQNSDGSWSPYFFAARGSSRDVSASLRATGCILEWLVASLPPDRMEDHRIVLSVNYVTGVLEGSYAQANVAGASAREIEGVMHALHALKIYDSRYFKLAAPDKPEKHEAPPETEAARASNATR